MCSWDGNDLLGFMENSMGGLGTGVIFVIEELSHLCEIPGIGLKLSKLRRRRRQRRRL